MGRRHRKRTRVMNEQFRSTENSLRSASGAGGKGDRGAGYEQTTIASGPLADRMFVKLYADDWSAQKIVNIPPEDMLKGGWRYEGLDEQKSDALKRLPTGSI